MRIAIMGGRGIPAAYSGFETLQEELGSRLAQRGHDVTVYCRRPFISYRGEFYKGMRLVFLRTVQNKYLDTLAHTFLASLHSLRQRYDAALICIAGNSPVAWIPRLAGTKVVIHVDGQDWRREKWPAAAKAYLQVAEWLAPRTSDVVLTDGAEVQKLYREQFHRHIVCIGYGAAVTLRPPGRVMGDLGLSPNRYVLSVGRLVPENCAHHLIAAFETIETDMKCVIVGDAPYADDYIRGLKRTTDSRVTFPGYVFGEGYQELLSNAYAFVETSSARGSHPALVEALAYGNCVIANGTPESVALVRDFGLVYDGSLAPESLRRELDRIVHDPQTAFEYRRKAADCARPMFSWETVTDEYEALFQKLVQAGIRR